MTHFTDILGTHWLAIALVVLALWRRWWWPGLLGGGALLFSFARFDSFDLSFWLFVTTASIGLLALVRLVWSGTWSYRFGIIIGAVLLFTLGGWLVPLLSHGLVDVGRALRGLEFVRPWWLTLLVCVPFVVLMGLRGLSGLGTTRKRIAIACRALLVALLVCALAEPRVRRSSEHVTVLFVIDRSFSIPPENDPVAKGRTANRSTIAGRASASSPPIRCSCAALIGVRIRPASSSSVAVRSCSFRPLPSINS